MQICADGFTNAAATVACRQLGFSGAGTVVPSTTYGPAPATSPIWLSNVKCTGTEASLADCKHLGWGNSMVRLAARRLTPSACSCRHFKALSNHSAHLPGLMQCEHYEDVGIRCMEQRE